MKDVQQNYIHGTLKPITHTAVTIQMRVTELTINVLFLDLQCDRFQSSLSVFGFFQFQMLRYGW